MFKIPNTDHSIPIVGLGLFKMTLAEMQQVIPAYHSISPLMHIDGATIYGNQGDLAACLKGLDRSSFFLTDKLWDTEHSRVESACRAALSRCQVDYFDLYLIHWPLSMEPGQGLSARRDAQGRGVLDRSTSLVQVWRDMESLVDKGLARSIGLSNFTGEQVSEIWAAARVRPAVLQIEVHPWLCQRELIELCERLGIIVEAYSPLGSGDGRLREEGVVKEIAGELGCTAAQVLLAFCRQRGLVALFKTGNVSRLKENLDSVHVQLSDGQMHRLYSLDRGRRLFDPFDWYKVKLF